MTLYELIRTRNNYYDLKDNITIIINQYNSAIDSLDLVIKNFNLSYSVDDNSVGREETINQKNKLASNKSFLKDQVIPAINYQITQLNKKIEQEQQKLT